MIRLRHYVLFMWSLTTQHTMYSQSTSALTDSVDYYRKQLVTQYKSAISAHRGASDVAPENTLATFRAVLTLQVDYIEIDVRTTKDGQLVILHDATLNRTTNGTGPVREQPLVDLKKLSAAKEYDPSFSTETVPTLEEVCQLLTNWNTHHSSKTNLYVDCKDVAPEPLVAILTKYDLLEDAVFYGSDEYLLKLQKTAPKVKLMPSLKNAQDMPDKISKLHPYAFDVNYLALNKSLVNQLHQQGIKVFSDLLDQYDTPTYYVEAAKSGVDVIQTDHVLTVYRTLATETNK